MAALIIKNCEVYSPKPLGKKDVLTINGKIIWIGKTDEAALERTGIRPEVIDGEGTYLTPGFIDPHEHLVGGDGEGGFWARTFPITLPEQVLGGITTVVGCLGVDTITYNMLSILGHARSLIDEGMNVFLWTGGYVLPSCTVTGGIRSDVLLIPEIIGAGELAVSDPRSILPRTDELAKVVTEAYTGGMLSQKCGCTHFHMGDGKRNLEQIFKLLKDYDIEPEVVYPTHVNRNPELLKQAVELTHLKVTVDMDTTEEKLAEELGKFVELGGDLEYVTISTDASFSSPKTLYGQLRDVMRELKWPLEKVLPLVTTNTARVLKLGAKGKIEIDADADLVLLDKKDLRIRDVVLAGKVYVREGRFVHRLKQLENSNRNIELHGKKEIR